MIKLVPYINLSSMYEQYFVSLFTSLCCFNQWHKLACHSKISLLFPFWSRFVLGGEHPQLCPTSTFVRILALKTETFRTWWHHQSGTETGSIDLCNRVKYEVDRSWTGRDIQSINQSINQSNFYSANLPGKARLSGTTAKSVFNSKIDQAVL